MNYDDKSLRSLMHHTQARLAEPAVDTLAQLMHELDALIASETAATHTMEAVPVESRLLGNDALKRELSEKSVAFVANEGLPEEVTILLTAHHDDEDVIIAGELLVDASEEWQKTNILLYVEKDISNKVAIDEDTAELHDYCEVDSKLAFSLRLARLNTLSLKIMRPDSVVVWLKDLTIRLL